MNARQRLLNVSELVLISTTRITGFFRKYTQISKATRVYQHSNFNAKYKNKIVINSKY